MNNFVAIDVETANPDFSSICQIGIAHFENGEVVKKWSSLVNPEVYFDSFNTGIHNINESDIKDTPTFKDLYQEISEQIKDKIVVHHTAFDKIAINRACQKYELEIIDAQWLDSSIVVKRTWTQFARQGYGLSNMADFLGLEFNHHDALQDATMAGIIVNKACSELEIDLSTMIEKTKYISRSGSVKKIEFETNKNGQLFGETILFTGALSVARVEAERMASEIGCAIAKSMNKSVTLLVVGIQDEQRLSGFKKSSKHRKAEELISKGASIQILSEDDFLELYNSSKE
ncbi:exonuclease domain-containing protein [Bernardetia sp.]|uniref:exonuclease domain-containing protein n=1 Tax=Bernardetia sp. TaxID=1937974 RepID=UPI0025B8D940|nr:exonuclease domain-containing protein [Bernardetia sp.]